MTVKKTMYRHAYWLPTGSAGSRLERALRKVGQLHVPELPVFVQSPYVCAQEQGAVVGRVRPVHHDGHTSVVGQVTAPVQLGAEVGGDPITLALGAVKCGGSAACRLGAFVEGLYTWLRYKIHLAHVYAELQVTLLLEPRQRFPRVHRKAQVLVVEEDHVAGEHLQLVVEFLHLTLMFVVRSERVVL